LSPTHHTDHDRQADNRAPSWLLSPLGKSGQPLTQAKYLSRPRRWVMAVEQPDGTELDVHLADPGRLHHLLQPGTPVLLDGPFADRKTTHNVLMAQADSGVWVSLVTTLPNKLFLPLLWGGHLPDFWHPPQVMPEIRREVKVGHSRLDYLLTYPDGEIYVEIKSLGWAVGDVGYFPDAPTARGKKHLETLIELQQDVGQTAVLFVAQRSDIYRIAPAWEIDPDFAQTLCEAVDAGVMLAAVGVEICPEGARFHTALDVSLEPDVE